MTGEDGGRLSMIQHETLVSETKRTHRRGTAPVRTCIGCRQAELAVELLRMVAVSRGSGEYTVTIDTAGTLPGRGAWLHPSGRCLQAAIRRRAFPRALRITGPLDMSGVVEHFERFEALDHVGKREQVAKQ